MKVFIYFLLVIILISGCSPYISYGSKEILDDNIIESLINNKTSQKEVFEKLKEPNKINFLHDGNEVWEYEYVFHTGGKYLDSEKMKNKNILYLVFNSSGILIKKRKALAKELLSSNKKESVGVSNETLNRHDQTHENHIRIHNDHHKNAIDIHKQHTELHNKK